MLKLSSMTGFGRAEGAAGALGAGRSEGALGVNGRNLEVRFRGPPGFDGLERLAREAAQGRFQRGQWNLSLQARRATGPGAAKVNRELLDRYVELTTELVAGGHATTPTADSSPAVAARRDRRWRGRGRPRNSGRGPEGGDRCLDRPAGAGWPQGVAARRRRLARDSAFRPRRPGRGALPRGRGRSLGARRSRSAIASRAASPNCWARPRPPTASSRKPRRWR